MVVLKAEGQALGCSQLGNCQYSLHCFLHCTTLGLSSPVRELSHQPKRGRGGEARDKGGQARDKGGQARDKGGRGGGRGGEGRRGN